MKEDLKFLFAIGIDQQGECLCESNGKLTKAEAWKLIGGLEVFKTGLIGKLKETENAEKDNSDKEKTN